MRAPATYLRSLDPRLPRQVWLVQAGGVVNSLGNGIVFPFIVIYLHNVRGISFAAAGLALAAGAVAALAAGLGAGTFVDRFGGRNTLLLGLLLQAVSFALFPLVREAWHAFILLALEGAGTACFWPGQSTLLSRLTPPERTHSAFALQRISMTLGLGLGGVLCASAALIVLFAGIWCTGTPAALVFVRAPLAFGLGETFQGPPQAPLVADPAPDRLRGRYFALGSMRWSAGSILGPAIGG